MCVKINYSNYFSQVDYNVRKNRLRIIFHRSTIMCVKIDYSNYFLQVDYIVRKNRLRIIFHRSTIMCVKIDYSNYFSQVQCLLSFHWMCCTPTSWWPRKWLLPGPLLRILGRKWVAIELVF